MNNTRFNQVQLHLFILLMGNKICCEETQKKEGHLDQVDPKMIQKPIIEAKHPQPQHKQQTLIPLQQKPQPEIKPQPISHHTQVISKPVQQIKEPQKIEQPIEDIEVPELTHQVAEKLKEFFEQQQNQSKVAAKRYGADVYVGTLDENGLKPHGFGRMYKEDKAHYIGYFNYGRAEGRGAYIFADGSYYYGEFHNNQANCTNGQFWSETLHYRGGFSNNVFEGQGIEQARTHTFKGHFHNGSRTQGLLEWHTDRSSYSYDGQFNNNNQFHGKGILRQPEGTYEGDFLNGEKYGNGEYKFANGAIYKGSYINGIRHGNGTIYQDGKIGYTGEFNEGLPHGKGSVPNKRGQLVETEWVNGIDKNMLSH